MATTECRTYTHTCDLCGAKCAKDDLDQFQMPLPRTNTAFRADPPSADVCEPCLARPVSDLKEFLDAEMARKGFVKVGVRMIGTGTR